jgi:hypothetical protein
LRGQKREPIKDPRVGPWSSYEIAEIGYSDELVALLEKLESLSTSPYLSNESIALVHGYVDCLERNVSRIEALLNELAQDFPEKYPELKLLDQASPDWVVFRWIGRRIDLVDPASAIVEHARSLVFSRQ